jgi:methyl-accepting chemotaxis protein
MLGNLRISFKLQIMVGLAVLGIVAVAAVGLMTLKANLLEDREVKLQELVRQAHQALQYEYQAARKLGLSEAETVERSKALLRAFRFGKDDYIYALDRQGVALAHPNSEGVSLLDVKDQDGVAIGRGLLAAASKGGGFVAYRYPRGSGGQPLPKLGYAIPFEPFGWAICSGIYIDDVDEIFWSQLYRVGALIGCALLLVVGASLVIGRSVVGPIAGMTAAMRKLAAGDTTTMVPARERGDEVGAMAQSVQVFKDNMIEAERLRAEQEASEKRTAAELAAQRNHVADLFDKSVQGAVDQVLQAGAAIEDRAEGAAHHQESGSKRSLGVADATTTTRARLQTLAAAAQEMSASITEISRGVSDAARASVEATKDSEGVAREIGDLAKSASEIGAVAQMISDIAGQTNLLALNATIEAARAGEAGKGFAVVAGEVKALAAQTARATVEITQQIGAIQERADGAVAAVTNVRGTIDRLAEMSNSVAASVEEQAAVTADIARNVNEVMGDVERISASIGDITRASVVTCGGAIEVLWASEDLGATARSLKTDAAEFVERIRA